MLADGHGNTIHLGERDCSIQRRHQKLIEESPAPEWVVDEALRERIGKIAVEAARAVDYRGAGTVEGLLDAENNEYFFLEMNTRVQVEHCVTEMTTGIDIVKAGIRVAAGEALPFTQDDVVLRGHAIECRINAEDASKKFAPAPGRIGAYVEPSGPGVRVDSGVRAGSEISPMYDPMVAKLIVWDADREQATARMLRALAEYEIEGLKTLIPFHRALLATEQWAKGETCRDLLEDAKWLKALAFDTPRRARRATTTRTRASSRPTPSRSPGASSTSASSARPRGRRRRPARPTARRPRRSEPTRAAREPRAASNGHDGDTLASPMQGSVWKIPVQAGQEVVEGEIVTIIEAMKMENEITAHKAGVIAELPISEGDAVRSGDVLAVIRDPSWPTRCPAPRPRAPGWPRSTTPSRWRRCSSPSAITWASAGRRRTPSSPPSSGCWRTATRSSCSPRPTTTPRPAGCCSCAFASASGRRRPTPGSRTCSSARMPAGPVSATRSITLAIERATARGAKRVELDCNEDNAAALALYARHGFSPRSKGSAGRDLFLGRPIDS